MVAIPVAFHRFFLFFLMSTPPLPPTIETNGKKRQGILAYNAAILDHYILQLKVREKFSDAEVQETRWILETYGNDYLILNCGSIIVEGAMEIWPFVRWFQEKMIGKKPSKKFVRDTLRKFFHFIIDDFSKLGNSPYTEFLNAMKPRRSRNTRKRSFGQV
ncbi:hypothetical protein [Acanthopleuribacter pedis]|uniref:Uncharacterized protein n=1 Tax=Acanthopleuribacter pedis TaxID=442870 RepID=A0A8J7Q5C6_9BACT|nr:hypothetical protein [Acanthopleuribacter pedis]MBO1319380.1 hypothetical protein [Acanthopleuribacter pedis]